MFSDYSKTLEAICFIFFCLRGHTFRVIPNIIKSRAQDGIREKSKEFFKMLGIIEAICVFLPDIFSIRVARLQLWWKYQFLFIYYLFKVASLKCKIWYMWKRNCTRKSDIKNCLFSNPIIVLMQILCYPHKAQISMFMV